MHELNRALAAATVKLAARVFQPLTLDSGLAQSFRCAGGRILFGTFLCVRGVGGRSAPGNFVSERCAVGRRAPGKFLPVRCAVGSMALGDFVPVRGTVGGLVFGDLVPVRSPVGRLVLGVFVGVRCAVGRTAIGTLLPFRCAVGCLVFGDSVAGLGGLSCDAALPSAAALRSSGRFERNPAMRASFGGHASPHHGQFRGVLARVVYGAHGH